MNGHHPLQGNLLRGQDPAYGLLRPFFLEDDLTQRRTDMQSSRNTSTGLPVGDNLAMTPPAETVTDREMWHVAVAAVAAEVERLSSSEKELLVELTGAVIRCKTAVHAIVDAVGAAPICASCGGECCRTGKYHFMVVDLLGYLLGAEPLFSPRFASGSCPYLGNHGCLMPPGLRPFNCIIFNCDKIDMFFGEGERRRLERLEDELRHLYGRFDSVCGGRFTGGLLMNFERGLLRERPANRNNC